MKKVIAIVAIFVLSILGLSSYNTNEVKKNETNSTLLAQLTNGGGGSSLSNGANTGTGGNKKQD